MTMIENLHGMLERGVDSALLRYSLGNELLKAGDADAEALYAGIAMAAFNVIGCAGWGRVDFMTGEDGQPQVLEVNTIPGMTSHSLVPMAARQAGIDFEELCWRILETSVSADRQTSAIEVAANDA